MAKTRAYKDYTMNGQSDLLLGKARLKVNAHRLITQPIIMLIKNKARDVYFWL